MPRRSSYLSRLCPFTCSTPEVNRNGGTVGGHRGFWARNTRRREASHGGHGGHGGGNGGVAVGSLVDTVAPGRETRAGGKHRTEVTGGSACRRVGVSAMAERVGVSAFGGLRSVVWRPLRAAICFPLLLPSPLGLHLARTPRCYRWNFGHRPQSPSVTSVTSVRCYPGWACISPGCHGVTDEFLAADPNPPP
jgi:hypothetical protein